MEFSFSPHAVEEIQEREIPIQVMMMVLNHPDAIVPERKNRNAYQAEVEINGKPYIVRAIVEPDGTVVTVYRTSKVIKYRSE
ncbi:MAG: DUF4258 domain-containing protein [Anaerolineae bacterium]|nr:DUF4258 domain-containing protein [Anaerolineae bacterium]